MGQAAIRRRARGVGPTGRPQPAEDLAVRAQRFARSGDTATAISLYAEAVSRGSTSPEVFNDLGTLLARGGQFPAAVVQYEMALLFAPGSVEIGKNLSKAVEAMSLKAFREKRWQDAAAGYGRLCGLDPSCVIFQTNAGEALRQLKLPDRALPHFRRAAELAPNDATVHLTLGSLLFDLHRREAETALNRALELDPTNIAALVNLAAVQIHLNQLEQSVETNRRALALNPEHPDAHGNIAGVLRQQGDIQASIEHYRRALKAQPAGATIFSGYLLTRQADVTARPADLLADHQLWASRFGTPIDPGPEGGFGPRDRDPHRRLRIGYVSADLRNHSVASFVEPLIAAHDRSQVEVFCYSSAKAPDVTTARIRATADAWREVRLLTDAELTDLVVRDQIDVLVDLSGHTGDHRLTCFARRPAPVQVTYCGYPATTGLSAIGWRLTDAVADPAGESDLHHAERLWRLPNGFLCFQPEVEDRAPAGALPALTGGFVTFGSFNNLAKLNDGVFDLWAEVLRAVPGSKLLLKCRGLGDDGPRQRVRARFATQGIDPDRIEIAPYAANRLEHLAVYNQVDIGLDSFPYNGTTTTCEALWKGVPVVTLRGTAHAGRVGASLMTHAGLPELVAHTPEAYVQTCARLAGDLAALATMRDSLPARVSSSPLGSPAMLARDIEAAFRGMWGQWCAKSSPEGSAQGVP
jgi:protein O-GlcNAc transferase